MLKLLLFDIGLHCSDNVWYSSGNALLEAVVAVLVIIERKSGMPVKDQFVDLNDRNSSLYLDFHKLMIHVATSRL